MTQHRDRAGVCTHKVASDHVARRDVGGQRWWRCSECGVVALWGDRWIYFGNVECLQCQTQRVDTVLCGKCGDSKIAITA